MAVWGRFSGFAPNASFGRGPITKVSVPLGVIGIIYESRPNVTVDAAGICLKAGNAVILRGGSEAFHSNMILSRLLDEAGMRFNLSPLDGQRLSRVFEEPREQAVPSPR